MTGAARAGEHLDAIRRCPPCATRSGV